MGTQIKAGSRGVYKNVSMPTPYDNKYFTVVEDVCSKSPTLVIKFDNSNPASKACNFRVFMSNVEFIYLFLEDY